MLTPWQRENWLWFKREDLFRPFGDNHVNGTKVRQYLHLFHHKAFDIITNHQNKLIVQTSVHSTSGAICAAVARKLNPNWKVTVVVGGLKEHHIDKHPMMRLAKYYGAEIRIVCGTGMSGPVMARLREICQREGHFNACLENYTDPTHNCNVLDPVIEQVRDIPKSVKTIYVPVGSGTQMAGIINGLHHNFKVTKGYAYARPDVKVVGLNVGPERNIKPMLHWFNDFPYEQISLNTQYSTPCNVFISGIGWLDTCYEAKAYEWMRENNLLNETNALWLVGRKLTSTEVDALYDSERSSQITPV